MNSNVKVTYSVSEQQIVELVSLYKQESWCNTRKLEDVREMLKKSWVVALTDAVDGKLVAFGRVLSDFMYRAFIYDVIVAKEYRGLGYGRFIIESILKHEDFKNVERIELNCIDKNVPFYNKLGFKRVPIGTNMMRYDCNLKEKA